MKRVIFSTILLISIAGFASAQSSGNGNTNPTSVSKSKASSKKAIPKQKRITDPEILDNRKEYMKDGQKATITGHDAAPTNGEQYQSIKDSANTKRKKQ